MKTTISRAGYMFAGAVVLLAFVLPLVSSCRAGYLFDIWYESLTLELDISPSEAVLEPDQRLTLTALGGEGPYSFVKLQGDGTLVDSLNGTVEYAAPAFGTNASIRLQDGFGRTIDASIQVSAGEIPQLYILPSSVSLVYGGSVSFGISGGEPPYVFSRVSGTGTLTDNGDGTADYTAPASNTDDVVQVEDASGQAAQAVVTVRAAPPTLAIVPAAAVMEEATNYMFTASGGTPQYMFSASGGSITDNGDGTADFTAPTAPATVTVTVADSAVPIPDNAPATVTVVAAASEPLTIVPRSINVTMGSPFQFSAEGGDEVYEYTMGTTYGGTVTPTGLYTAPSDCQGVETVIVTDSRGITDTATVKVKKK